MTFIYIIFTQANIHPENMAAGGHTSTDKRFKLPSDIMLTVCRGDIGKTAAVAITTGEDECLSGHGAVSKVLLKLCSKTYKEEREKMKKNAKKLEFGEVYSCSSGKHGTKSGSISFDTVYHAIVPQPKICRNWEDVMGELYMHLLNAAEKDGKKSLAVPLLGSGGAGASVDDAVKPIADTLVKFRHRSIRSSLLDVIIYCQRDEAFKKLTAKMEDVLKHQSSAVAGSEARPKSVSKRPSTFSRNKVMLGTKKMAAFGQANSVTRTSTNSSNVDVEDSNLAVILDPDTYQPLSKKTGTTSVSAILSFEEDVQDSFEHLNVKDVKNPGSNLVSILGTGSAGDWDCNQDDDGDSMGDAVDIDVQGEGEISKKETRKQEEGEDDSRCPICLDKMEVPKKLQKCGHIFCKECIEDSFRHHKPVCPTCNTVYGIIIGNQPQGTMDVSTLPQSLPGYANCGILMIDYYFPHGTQGKEHPNPGHMYTGTRRRAFLPNNTEGIKVCRLLRVAFDNRLTFTVGRSTTTGVENTVTWNDIHHKTSIDGGPTAFGYPDPHYLSRVQEELAARGVTEECLKDPKFKFDV